jgi:RNA polymerase sigma-70 factor (ECF subfamily)
VSATSEAVGEIKAGGIPFDIGAIFVAHFERVARIIARVVGDPSRSEELAVEVFLKLWRTPRAQGEKAAGWLYRAAVRKGLDELRHRSRRSRYESLFGFIRRNPTPEEILGVREMQGRVRLTLAAIAPRHAELLLLHSHGLNYNEVASSLGMNPASIGTLLHRAQLAFRKEYIKQNGQE